MKRLSLSLFSRCPSKYQKHIISNYSQKNTQNIKKIELMNGEVKQMTGFSKMSITNKQAPSNTNLLDDLFAYFDKATLSVFVYLLITLNYYTPEPVLMIQCALFLLHLLLRFARVLRVRAAYMHIEKHLNSQECYIISQFKHNAQHLNQDSMDDYNSFYVPQTKVKRLNLKIGDLILLERQHECPADVLLLEASSPTVSVDQSSFGEFELAQKIPCQSTFVNLKSDTKGLLVEFKLNLNAQIAYNYKPGKMTSLQGSLKLKSDPKMFKFKHENVIFCGEKLMNTDWAIGIVLVSGDHCLRIRQPNLLVRAEPFRFIILSFCALAFLLSLLEALIYDDLYSRFLTFNSILLPLFLMIYQEADLLFTLLKQEANWIFVDVDSGNLPILTNRGSIVQQDDKYVQIEFNKVKNFTQVETNARPHSKKDLNFRFMLKPINEWQTSMVNIVCLEISEDFLVKHRKVQAIIIDESEFSFKISQLKKIMANSQNQLANNYFKALLDTGRDGEVLEEERKDWNDIPIVSPTEERIVSRQAETLILSTNNKKLDHSQKKLAKSQGRAVSFKTKLGKSSIDSSTQINQVSKNQFTEHQFIQKLFDSSDNLYHEKVVAMLLLCQIENKYNDRKKTIEISVNEQDDQVIVEFCNALDYKLKFSIDSDRLVYDQNLKITIKVIEIQGKLKKYQVLSVNAPTKSRPNLTSLILKDPEEFNDDEGALLYLRLDHQDIFENSSFNLDINQTNSTLYYMLQHGQKPVIYLKKQLKRQEAAQFLESKLNIISQQDEDQLDKLYSSLEAGSELLMIIGLKNRVRSSVIETFNRFSRANMNTWLFTANDQFSVLRLLFEAKLIEHENNLIIIDQDEERAIQFQIDLACANLIKLQGILSKQDYEKKFLIVHGNSFLIINKNPNLLRHFAIILEFSKGLAFYSTNEKCKSKIPKLAKLLRREICFVGSSSDNRRVYNRSLVSIEISDHVYSQTNPNFIVSSLEQAEEIITIKALSSMLLAKSVLYFYIYQILLFALIKLIYIFVFQELAQLLLIFVSQVLTIVIQILDHYHSFSAGPQVEALLKQKQQVGRLFDKFSFFRIIINVITDALILSVPLFITKYLYGDSNYLPLSQVAFVTTTEIIIRISLTSQLRNNHFTLYLYQILATLLLFVISFFTQLEFSEYKTKYTDYFYSPGYIIRTLLFSYLFALIFKIGINRALQVYGLEQFCSPILISRSQYAEMDKLRQNIVAKYQSKLLKEKLLNQIINRRKKFIRSLVSDNNKLNDSIYKAMNNNSFSNESIELQNNLTFAQREQEQKYKEFQNLHFQQTSELFLAAFSYEFIIFVNLLIQISQDGAKNVPLYVVWAILILYSLLLVFFANFEVVSKNVLAQLVKSQIFFRLVFFILSIYMLSKSFYYNQIIMMYILTQVMLSVSIKFVHKRATILALQLLASLALFIKLASPEYYFTQTLLQIFLVFHFCVIMLICLMATYMISFQSEYLRRKNFMLQQTLEYEQKKLNGILGLLMPKFINDRMVRGYIHIQEDQGQVAILFCDICQFDKIIDAEGRRIIGLLDKLYRHFDQICNQLNVQKIETVGKTYLCAAGLKDYDVYDRNQKSPTQRILECAIMMIEAAGNIKYGTEAAQVILKIGINYGHVMAGVIGSHKPQFSLIGDTVNTTSRVCTTGQDNKITLSESAYMKVKHIQKYKFIQKEIQAKGKGSMQTFQLIQAASKQQSSFAQRADKTPIIKLVNSIPIKQLDGSPRSNDPLGNAVNPIGFSIRTPTENAPTNKSINRVIHNMLTIIQPQQNIQNYKYQQEISQRRQTIQRATRMTKFKDLNPFLKNSQMLKQSKMILSKSSKADQFSSNMQQNSNHAGSPIYVQNQNGGGQPQNFLMIDSLLGDFKHADSQKNLDQMKPPHQAPSMKKLPSPEQAPRQTHNKLFESTMQQEDRIEIPKLQFLIGNQEKIESDVMQELVRMKCFDTPMQSIQGIESPAEFESLILIYDSVYYKEKMSFIVIYFLLLLLLQIYTIFLILNEQSSLGVNMTIIAIKVVLIFFSTIIIPYCFRDTHKNFLYCGLIGAYIIHFTFTTLMTQLNQDHVHRIYFTLQLAVANCLSHYVRSLPFLNHYWRYAIQIVMLIQIFILLGLKQEWNETIIFVAFIELLLWKDNSQNQQILLSNYSIYQQQLTQKQRQQKVVQHLLPPHILQNFINEQDSPTDVFENATILFADIAGFTKYSASVDAQQVLQMLSSLFNKFDQSCAEFNLYKLYTIGDCYVVMGILDAQNGIREEEAFNVVNFAFRMIEIINQVKQNLQYQHLNMRIGIHTGTIIGGIVGTDIVRYDIYGEDVALANKMESNGAEGKVMVSEATMNFLESTYPGYFSYTYGAEVKSTSRTLSGYFIERTEQVDE